MTNSFVLLPCGRQSPSDPAPPTMCVHVPQPSNMANFNATVYDFIWNIGQRDIEGGIVQLSEVYLANLDRVYQ